MHPRGVLLCTPVEVRWVFFMFVLAGSRRGKVWAVIFCLLPAEQLYFVRDLN